LIWLMHPPYGGQRRLRESLTWPGSVDLIGGYYFHLDLIC
jgi:hypothetical protein